MDEVTERLLVFFDEVGPVADASRIEGFQGPGDGIEARLGTRIADPQEERFASAGRVVDAGAAALLELWGPGGADLVGAAERIFSDLGAFDLASGRLALGTVVTIMPGTGRLGAFHLIRRLPTLSVEQFREYWSGGHTRHSRTVPGLTGYQQLHVDEAASAVAAARLGVRSAGADGFSSIRADDVDAYAAVVGSEQALRGIQDNAVFVDVPRSPWLGLYETVALGTGG
jgi:EthD domain